MKKYFVIGNPIGHSLSPRLHNYWIKKNNLEATYDKEKLNSRDLRTFILKIKNKEIDGANVTVPFKKEVIPYLDKLTIHKNIWTDQLILSHIYKDREDLFHKLCNGYGNLIPRLY